MWLKPGGRAMPFTATQSFAVDRVAFAWQARFRLIGPLALSVVDDFDDGHGQLAVRLFGAPLQRQRGAEVSAGQALRYLAELPWVPPAIVGNPQLEWRGLDGRHAEVAANVAGERLTVTLEFGDAGDVVRARSKLRKRKVDGHWEATAWGGAFREYAQLGSLRLPTAGAAYWELPEGRYVYWRGTVTSAELLEQPFRGDDGD